VAIPAFCASNQKAAAVAEAVTSLLGPGSAGAVSIDEVVFEPHALRALLARHGFLLKEGRGTNSLRDWTVEAARREKVRQLLEAALADGIDFLFQSSAPELGLYADHDDYLTFYSNTRAYLVSLAETFARADVAPVEGYHAPAADFLWWNTDEPGGQAVRSISFLTGHGGFQFEDYRLRFKRPQPDPEHAAWLRKLRGLKLTHPEFRLLPDWSIGASEARDEMPGNYSGWPDLWGDPPRIRFYVDRQEDRSYLNSWHGVVLPYRLPAALSSLPPALWLGLRFRRVLLLCRRRRLGPCLRCGYDLTGNSSGRCPECGSAVPEKGAKT
jgi:hypothetical protein